MTVVRCGKGNRYALIAAMNPWIVLLAVVLPMASLAGEMIEIPAGAFRMGCTLADHACESDEGTPGGQMVNVPAFAIDRYEVTVAEYRECVRAGRCRKPIAYAPDNFCNFDAPGRDNFPVNCVDWHEADHYCRQQGKHLPWEAEWEKAARAGSQEMYIWHKAPTCQEAVLNDGVTQGSAAGELDGCGEDRTDAVGTRTPNAFGLYDMFGNVSEWVANWHHPQALKHYARGDLHWPSRGQRKVIRGGAWDEGQRALRNASRYAKPPHKGHNLWGSNGIRCARDITNTIRKKNEKYPG